MRKRLEQSRLDNPNWLEKIENELSERFAKEQIDIILDSSPSVIKFKDSTIIGGNGILSYSSEVVN